MINRKLCNIFYLSLSGTVGWGKSIDFLDIGEKLGYWKSLDSNAIKCKAKAKLYLHTKDDTVSFLLSFFFITIEAEILCTASIMNEALRLKLCMNLLTLPLLDFFYQQHIITFENRYLSADTCTCSTYVEKYRYKLVWLSCMLRYTRQEGPFNNTFVFVRHVSVYKCVETFIETSCPCLRDEIEYKWKYVAWLIGESCFS